MAERRMFAKSVINSGRFLQMPPTSRLLYYDLGMAADDDGVVEAFTVIRTTGAAEDDLRVLAARGFITVLNEDFVTYINDWKKNNLIKNDRYKPSVYKDLLVKVEDGTQVEPRRNPDGTQVEPQDRLGKESIGKVNTPPISPPRGREADFERFWNEYPKKVGKKAAWKAFQRIKEPLETLLTAIERQKCGDQWSRENGRYIPNPATWLNQGRWEDEVSCHGNKDCATNYRDRIRTDEEYMRGGDFFDD